MHETREEEGGAEDDDEPVKVLKEVDPPDPLEDETLLVLVGSFLTSGDNADLGRTVDEGEGLELEGLRRGGEKMVRTRLNLTSLPLSHALFTRAPPKSRSDSPDLH